MGSSEDKPTSPDIQVEEEEVRQEEEVKEEVVEGTDSVVVDPVPTDESYEARAAARRARRYAQHVLYQVTP